MVIALGSKVAQRQLRRARGAGWVTYIYVAEAFSALFLNDGAVLMLTACFLFRVQMLAVASYESEYEPSFDTRGGRRSFKNRATTKSCGSSN